MKIIPPWLVFLFVWYLCLQLHRITVLILQLLIFFRMHILTLHTRLLLMLLVIKWKFGKFLLSRQHYLLYCFTVGYYSLLYSLFIYTSDGLDLLCCEIYFLLASSKIILLLIIKVSISTQCRGEKKKKECLRERKRNCLCRKLWEKMFKLLR